MCAQQCQNLNIVRTVIITNVSLPTFHFTQSQICHQLLDPVTIRIFTCCCCRQGSLGVISKQQKKSVSLSPLQVSDFYLLIYEVSRFHGTTSFSHLMNELTPQELCACVFHVPLEATNCADTRQRQMKNDHLPSYTKISPPEGTITQSNQLTAAVERQISRTDD